MFLNLDYPFFSLSQFLNVTLKKKDMTPLVSHRGVAANAIVIDSSATEYTLQYYGLCIDTRVRDTVTMAGLIPIIHENASSIINIGHPRCS